MCGITGVFGFSYPLVSENTLRKMTNTLAHRGPDSNGVYIKGSIGFGHTRLSILDLSPAGHQPMQSVDGSVTLIYNGELYNYKELRKILIKKGRSFKSSTDTEVVLQSYMEWGTDIFSKFEGMFAFAIWDTNQNTLILARDRFGIKPLYYSVTDSGIVFGSEIKALLASGIIKKEIDEKSLHEYLWYGNALGSNTLFKGIYKLLPGNYMKIQSDKIEINEYWNIQDIQETHQDFGDVENNVYKKLESAVKSHLISDVPVGVFLSGGIDSSAITALASKHYNGTLKTFSVGFDFDQGVNELPNARKVANLFNTDHQELHITAGDLPGIIEKLIGCHDEPFADAANIPLFLLSRKLEGSIKVILQGDGGDEIFAGYRRYNLFSNESLWHLITKLGYPFRNIFPKFPLFQRYNRFMDDFQQIDPALRMALILTQDSPLNDPTDILNLDLKNSLLKSDPFSEYKYWNLKFSEFDSVRRMLYTDCKILLPNTFLEKVDKPTMANSIEVRVPFLDNNLTDYVMGLPSNYKIRFGNKKWVLKQALKNVLPSSILNGKKRGFSVPIDYWLKEPLSDYMCSVLLDKEIENGYLFNKKILRGKIDNHVSGKENNGFALWKALNLAVWYNNYMN